MKIAFVSAVFLLQALTGYMIQDGAAPAVQTLSAGSSGAIQIQNGTIDVVPSVVPRLPAANEFTGLDTFRYFGLVPSSEAPIACDPNIGALGQLWFDSSNPQTSHLRMCAMDAGKPAWIQLY